MRLGQVRTELNLGDLETLESEPETLLPQCFHPYWGAWQVIERYRRVKEDEPCRADDREWNNYE